MDILDDIRTTLNSNANLSQELKDNIFELVVLFNKNFPNVALDDLKQHLATLKIQRLNKFLNNDISMYDNRTNILYLNASKLEKGYDGRHVLMYELLNMISSNEYQMGFDKDGKFEALNIGYTEILANYLVGNDGEFMFFPDEAIATNLISVMIGSDVLERAYFNHDTDLLIESLNKVGV